MSQTPMRNKDGRGKLRPAVAEYLAASGGATLDELVDAIAIGGLPHKRASIISHLNDHQVRPGEPRRPYAYYRRVGDRWTLAAQTGGTS